MSIWIFYSTENTVHFHEQLQQPDFTEEEFFFEWINGKTDCSKLLEEWGWNWTDAGAAGLFPVPTDIAPAPPNLLKVMWCNCTTNCGGFRWSCQIHGRRLCSMACGQYLGISHSNASTFLFEGKTLTLMKNSSVVTNWNVNNSFVLIIVLPLRSTYIQFLDTTTHLYKRLCPSVTPSIGPYLPCHFQKMKMVFWR